MKVRLGFFLLVIVAALLFSCEKNIETSEEDSNKQFLEQELTDNSENNEDKLSSGDHGENLPLFIEFVPYTMPLPYEYDGHWSMRFDEYFMLDNGNKDIHSKKDIRL